MISEQATGAFDYTPSSFTHKYTTLGGYKYHYVEEGDPQGPTIVLIHGFPDFWYGWRYQIRFLASIGYRVIAVDNLGSGETEVVKCQGLNVDPYRSKKLAANLIQLLDQLHIPKATFIGHDWGAWIAWKVGMYFADRCHAIISVGNPHFQPSKEYFGPQQIADMNPTLYYMPVFEKQEMDDFYMGRHEITFEIVYGTEIGTSKEERQYYIETFKKSGYHGPLNLYRSFRLNHEDDQEKIGVPYTVPSLLMVVKHDAVLYPEFVSRIKKDLFVDLEQILLEEGTHFVTTERPDLVNQAIQDFLVKLDDRSTVVSGSVAPTRAPAPVHVHQGKVLLEQEEDEVSFQEMLYRQQAVEAV